MTKLNLVSLPKGTFVVIDGDACRVGESTLERWHPAGYGASVGPRANGLVEVLTPPSIRATMAAGYRPDMSVAHEE